MGRVRRAESGAPDRHLAPRSWVRATDSDPSSVGFTMMSYNILSDSLLFQNFYLYSGCNSTILKWQYRFDLLCTEISVHDPSILCVQEVDKAHWESFAERLGAMGFQGYFCGRTGSKPDGCALFWCAQPTWLMCHYTTQSLNVKQHIPFDMPGVRIGCVTDIAPERVEHAA